MKGMFSMLPYIYEDLKEACQNLPVSLAAGCAVMILVFFICRFTRRRIPLIPVFLWAAYLEQLLWLVYLNRAPGSRRSLDLGLFDTISRSAREIPMWRKMCFCFFPLDSCFPCCFRLEGGEGSDSRRACSLRFCAAQGLKRYSI